MRGARRHGLIALVAAVAGCQPAGVGAASPPGIEVAYDLAHLIGEWRWLLRAREAQTTRVEDERWVFAAGASPHQLVGRYVRAVEVSSDDGAPFLCNQRPWYAQRALWDVEVEVDAAGVVVRETGYDAEPSPCDHGFRHLGSYAATLAGDRLRLAFDGGAQELWKVGDGAPPGAPSTAATLADADADAARARDGAAAPALPRAPWPARTEPTGRWRWDASSVDAAGNRQDESEWWDIVRRSDDQLDASYRRRVTITSPDGRPLACAGAPRWSLDEAYLLDGRREDEHWHFFERAADAGGHPCLAASPRRTLDEATAEQLGDHLVLEWRGKRRQVLHRPDPSPR